MKLRTARHTADLQPILAFYCGILGLKILGKFDDHDGYDGVFFGNPGADWHLEFTVSAEKPSHQSDEDDLLVFYAESEAAFKHLTEQFQIYNIQEIQAKNPYWNNNGKTYADPDGFRIVIAKPYI